MILVPDAERYPALLYSPFLPSSEKDTADEIKSFAERFDPQPFHLDEAVAEQSHFGALCASGWHTVLIWMRLRIVEMRHEVEAQRTRGEPIAQLGPSPGFRELKWLEPVYAGDTITYASEVMDARPLDSRPGWGLVQYFNSGVNQPAQWAAMRALGELPG